MTDVTIFENEKFGKVRTVIRNDGEPLFCGKDVADALGYERARDAISAHCKGAVKHRILTNGGVQEMSFITEGDLYRLVCSSKLPKAQEFEEWVFDEVLPSIRKTGVYKVQPQMSDKEIALKERVARLDEAKFLKSVADEYSNNVTYKQILDAYSVKTVVGEFVLPLPEMERKTYSATEIGQQLGITAHKVGMIANEMGLKTQEFGKYFIDKSRNSSKEVETFRYFDSVIPQIEEYMKA